MKRTMNGQKDLLDSVTPDKSNVEEDLKVKPGRRESQRGLPWLS